MATPKLTDYKYLIFDVYGTLADWETGVYTALQPLLRRFPSASQWSQAKAIREVLSIESDIQSQYPSMQYSDVLAKAHEVLEARLSLAEGRSAEAAIGNPPSIGGSEEQEYNPTTNAADVHTIFGNSIKRWAPFPDSSQALHDLSKRYHLIVLSNVDHASFAYTHTYLSEGSSPNDHGDIEPTASVYIRPSPNPHPRDLWLPNQITNSKSPFSLILTAQDTGAYKPSHTGFLAVFDAIQSEPALLVPPGSINTPPTLTPTPTPTIEEIKCKTLVVAQSLTHDHVPAKELGISSVWIDRPGAALRPVPPVDVNDFGWRWRFETLGDMARAVAGELEG
ncbi:hypothetical protein H0H81_000819 [Sphagnurus paluster]|uniref:Haloacid dehalogenase n=1 Tax=Sphagnurus paluster TaxID=117069 RepID=A0A9P7K6M9_9AGAR|nr:hypothetical protein H0H81_000819 [Sphagnurus paluster]